MNPKKIIILAVGVAALALIAWRVRLALLCDEDLIRRMVPRIAAAFNRAEAGSVTSHLAEDFTEEQSGMGKDEVRAVLLHLFLSNRGKDGTTRFQVEAPAEGIEVQIDPKDPAAADLRVRARFLERRSPPDRLDPMGDILFTGRLKKADGQWRIARARHKQIEGRSPF